MLVGTLAVGRRSGDIAFGELLEAVGRTFADLLAIQTAARQQRDEDVRAKLVAQEPSFSRCRRSKGIFAQLWRITGSWRSDGAEHIRQKYDETIGWIAWNPEVFPKKYGLVRRAILKRAYYIVYFVLERDRSLVFAVLDGRREPRGS